jgi:3-oxoacyl-ACP reductase-like protein
MKVSSAAAAILILSATTVWAQGSSSVGAVTANASANSGRPIGSRMVVASPPENGPENKMASGQTSPALLRMQETEATLKKMHALLMQMRAKAGSSGSKDAFTKANLDMWQLMLGQLDKQFELLKAETLAREELAARRADLYKQADAKAALEAARARRASASATAAKAGAAGQGAAGSGGPAAAGSTATHSETEKTSAPDSSSPK